MITKNLINKFYEDVESLKLKFPVAAISKATGFSKGNVSQYLAKKGEPSENFLKAFYEAFGKSFKKVSHETAAAEPDVKYENKKSLTEEALLRLAKSNENMSESVLVLARNQEEIIARLPSKSTADAGAEIPLGIEIRFSEILELIADVGTGKRWKNRADALEELNKFVIEKRQA